ncbi:hypothetical protein ABPG74_015464 [Tetrahymena malaccensis]
MKITDLKQQGQSANIDQECIYNYDSSFQNQQSLQSISNQCDQSNFQSQDSCIYQECSDSFQMQLEGYEMSDLLEKFDNISKNNISKNIIKSFLSYLLDTKKNDLLTEFALKGTKPSYACKMAKNYFKLQSFNNKSLHKLIQHPKYGKAFEFYLTFEAERWLAGSKVQQKQTHLIYIDFLKLCCSNPKYQEYIISYKKSKKNKYDDRS